jgi:predicted esterase
MVTLPETYPRLRHGAPEQEPIILFLFGSGSRGDAVGFSPRLSLSKQHRFLKVVNKLKHAN